MSPEVQLLLCCARPRMGPEVTDQLQTLLRRGLDWPRLLQLARRHGMMPLLYRHLEASQSAGLSLALPHQLRDRFQANSRRSFLLAMVLLKLLGLFRERGILAVPFKGPTLAASVYGDFSLRQCGDLDIWVEKRDVPRAAEALAAHGYLPKTPLSARAVGAWLRSEWEHHLTFVDGAGRARVELSWEITPWYFACPLDFRGYRERLERVSLLGTPVFSFAAEDLLLLLCVHGAKHCWERVIWTCDVAELIRTRPLQWEQVFRCSEDIGAKRMLLLGLRLAQDLLQADLPQGAACRDLAEPAVDQLSQVVHGQLKEGARPLEEADRRRFHLQARERLSDRIRYCRRLAVVPGEADRSLVPFSACCILFLAIAFIPNERDRTFLPLPAALSFLWYLVRPIRLVGKYFLALGKRLGRLLADSRLPGRRRRDALPSE